MISGHAFLRGYCGAEDVVAAYTSAMHACSHCGKPDATKRCSRCGSKRYCSKTCQAAAWSHHKRDCTAGSGGVRSYVPPKSCHGGVVPPELAAPIPYSSPLETNRVFRPWAAHEEFVVSWGGMGVVVASA